MADNEMADHELFAHCGADAAKWASAFCQHFVTGSGSPDHLEWTRMVEAGLAWRLKSGLDGDDLFWLTEEGARAALNSGERLTPEDFPVR